jgi:type III pantothenate kinase
MTWLIDLGNSRAKFSRWDGAQRGDAQALAHGDEDFPSRLVATLGPAARDARVMLASVAPAALTAELTQRLEDAGYRCERVATAAQALGVRIAYPRPERLGVDRFLALLAAHARDDGPWLLVSVGSALTADLLDVDGQHHGGLIAPSPRHARESLAARFPVLAADVGSASDWAIDTDDAVASGALAAAAGLVERAHRLARERLGAAPTVLVSGGEAGPVRAALPFATQAWDAPVLDGLARLAASRESA